MTAATATRGRPEPRPLTGSPGVPFARLFGVELRKQVDMRAGLWLLGIAVLVATGVIVLMLTTADPVDLSWQSYFLGTSMVHMILLPLVGILAATGDWSQRTALSVFTVEPRRTRVNVAKLGAALALGLAVIVATAVAAAAANGIGIATRDAGGAWDLEAATVAGATVTLLLFVLQGVGFGLALLSTPAAIAAYLVLPTAWSIVAGLVPGLWRWAEWLDMNLTVLPLAGGTMTSSDWPRLLVSVAVWVGVPLAIGLRRTARRDVA